MPLIDDTSLANLELAVKEITFRSNRIREWIELEPRLRSLKSSFEDIFQLVDAISGMPKNSRLQQIKKSWNNCKITDLEDLKSFALGAQHIKTTLPAANSAVPAPLIDSWVMELLALGTKIQNDLDSTAINALKTDCNQFQDQLHAYIAEQRNQLGREVRELCELTIQLRIRLGT